MNMDFESRQSLDQYTRRGIDHELNQWGKWVEDHSTYEGFNRNNVLIGFLFGGGGGKQGHRVLCLDMPARIYATHGRILRLPEGERDAVYLYFAVRVKPDGTLWKIEEKCLELGIQEASIRRRLCRARYRIAGLPVPRWHDTKRAIAAVSGKGVISAAVG